MTVSQPISTSPLNSPDHSLMHRQIATDPSAPVKSIVVDATGQVGIGTDSPSNKLTVSGNTDVTGFLGIGTDERRNTFGQSNTGKLVLEGTDYATSLASIVRNSDDTGGGMLYLAKSRGTSVNSYDIVQSGDTLGIMYFGGTYGTSISRSAGIWALASGTLTSSNIPADLIFGTEDSGLGNPVERMRITSTGNIGIGTTSPDRNLHIYDSGGYAQALIEGNTSSELWFGDSTDFNIGRLYYDHTDNSLAFQTNNSEAMRIDNTGNIGIGTTGPTAKLDINSDILRLRTAKTPATSGAAGNQGDIAWDTGFIYVCTATNTWKKATIATW